MNAGPARIPQHHTTLEYCRELGVPIEVFANQNADGWYFNELENGALGPLTDRRIRHRTAKADYFGYVSELLAKATSQGALDADLRPEDAERMIEIPRGIRGARPRDALRGRSQPRLQRPARRRSRGRYDGTSAVGVGPARPASSGSISRSKSTWDQAMLMFQPVGGMDPTSARWLRRRHRRPDPLRHRGPRHHHPRRRRRGRRVGRPRGQGDRRRLLHLHDPAARAGHDPEQPLDRGPGRHRSAADRCPWPRWASSSSAASGRKDEGIFGGITTPTWTCKTIWYPSYGYLGERGVLIGYYNFFDTADSYGVMTPKDRERRALEQGRKIHGDAYVSGVPGFLFAALVARAVQRRRLGRVARPDQPGRRRDVPTPARAAGQALPGGRPHEPRDVVASTGRSSRPGGRHPAPPAVAGDQRRRPGLRGAGRFGPLVEGALVGASLALLGGTRR